MSAIYSPPTSGLHFLDHNGLGGSPTHTPHHINKQSAPEFDDMMTVMTDRGQDTRATKVRTVYDAMSGENGE